MEFGGTFSSDTEPALENPSPQSQVAVCVSYAPGSVKEPLKLIWLPSSTVLSVPSKTSGATFLTFTVKVNVSVAPSLSVTVSNGE